MLWEHVVWVRFPALRQSDREILSFCVSHYRVQRFMQYSTVITILFTAVWFWSAIDPVQRGAWFLENILVGISFPLVLFFRRYFRLSNTSYTLIIVFLILHVIGAHYTYAEVPFGHHLGEFIGTERNMYDRLVHFSFGLLIAYPMREALFRVARMRGLWSYLLPFDITLSVSAIFEIFEWGIVHFTGQDIAVAFLATGGDPWDAQKDLAIAGCGALVTLALMWIFNWRYSTDFRVEMRESLKSNPTSQKSESEVKLKTVISEKQARYRARRERKKQHRYE